MPNHTCKDCQFWDERGDLLGTGLCRRRAPHYAIGWPETDGKKDWCGQMLERPGIYDTPQGKMEMREDDVMRLV